MRKLYIVIMKVAATVMVLSTVPNNVNSQTSETNLRPAGGLAAINEFKAIPDYKMVDIYWNTSAELNVERFDIEYSPDGNNYAFAGSVSAKGGATMNEYRFVHNYLKTGKIYYRIRVVNYDGSYQYSNAVITEYNGYTANYNFIYPSSVRRGYPVELYTKEPFDKVEMISQSGAILFKQNIKGIIGRLQIPASINSSGIYYVQLSRNDRSMIQRIMVTD